MVGTIELDPDGKTLLIAFPYDPHLVAEVKSLPSRRWDRGSKQWRVPARDVESVVALFMRHGFAMSSDVSSLLAGTQGQLPLAAEDNGAAATPATPEEKSEPDALSISALNERARAALLGGFPEPVWVIGELSDYDKNKDRKHIFFTMLEKRGEHINAQVTAVMFERTVQTLRKKLESLPEPMSLSDGIEIRALVRVDLYPARGNYQLIVEDIDASFTLGKLALSREEILRELREKGLDKRNLELPLPIPALRVGVLCSIDSDGWNDFHKEIEGSGLGFEICAYNVRVQGEQLRPTMLQGLRYFTARKDDFDVLCILRGGGSRTDLAWFDDREVALAVAQCELKILCGIGHQRDQSVLDIICHSEKTPTALADFLVEQVRSCEETLRDLSRYLVQTTQRLLQAEDRRLGELAQDLRRHLQSRLVAERRNLAAAGRRLALGTRHRLRREQDLLVRSGAVLRAGLRLHLQGLRGELGTVAGRIGILSQRLLERQQARLNQASARLRLLDPGRVLQRGYTLVRGKDGEIHTSLSRLQAGETLDIRFRDGSAEAEVRALHPED